MNEDKESVGDGLPYIFAPAVSDLNSGLKIKLPEVKLPVIVKEVLSVSAPRTDPLSVNDSTLRPRAKESEKVY